MKKNKTRQMKTLKVKTNVKAGGEHCTRTPTGGRRCCNDIGACWEE